MAEPTSLTAKTGADPLMKASQVYSAKVRIMIASWDGLSTRVETHEKRKAGSEPNASIK